MVKPAGEIVRGVAADGEERGLPGHHLMGSIGAGGRGGSGGGLLGGACLHVWP